MILENKDCIEFMKTLPDKSIDMILADPPYGTTACKWDTIIPFDLMWLELKRIIKPNGAIVLFGSEPYTSTLICSNLTMFKYRWVWKKNKYTGFLNAKKQPLRCIEDICVFYNLQCNYYPQKTQGHKPVNKFTKNTTDGQTMGKTTQGMSGGGQTDRHPTNCIQHIPVMNNDGSHGIKNHPTQKPVGLMEYLIKTYTLENETVLDFTMGSGTTGVACVNTNRNFIGCELDETYFNIAKERIENQILAQTKALNLEKIFGLTTNE